MSGKMTTFIVWVLSFVTASILLCLLMTDYKSPLAAAFLFSVGYLVLIRIIFRRNV